METLARASRCTTALLPQCRSLLPAPLALQSCLVSSEYGRGTKAALLLAERAVQMFEILPALTSQIGKAPVPDSSISARQRERERGRLASGQGPLENSKELGVLCLA